MFDTTIGLVDAWGEYFGREDYRHRNSALDSRNEHTGHLCRYTSGGKI